MWEATSQTIAFVDANVFNSRSLLSGLEADIKVLLDPTRDGISQITETLAHYENLTGIDIISNGNVAQVQLGNSVLNINTLKTFRKDVTQWGKSLTPNGDILFYGCNVAAGDLGKAFVNRISRLTKADVAASIDVTGNSAFGGNWNLEYSTGNIEASSPITSSLEETYKGLLTSGVVSISGTTTQNQTLTATVTDVDGITGVTVNYQWQQLDGSNWTNISGATGSSLTLQQAQVGKRVRVSATYTDALGSNENVFSLATTAIANVNDIGVVAITGTPVQGGIVTARVTDLDGLTNVTINYQWQQLIGTSWSNISGATSQAFTLQPAQVGRQIRVRATYTDALGGSENTRTSSSIPSIVSSNPIGNNDIGVVSISGTTTQNQTLTATVTDVDGLTGVTINYQWQQLDGSNWTNISGATGSSLTLQQAQVGKRVKVSATYTDALGSNENVFSLATTAIANVNDIGVVAITGTPVQGGIVTARVTDLDGLTNVTINYQWQQLIGTGWSNISGATSQTFTLQPAQVGRQIRVRATYTDALGGSENTRTSSPTPSIINNVNTVGTIAITGTPTQNQILAANVIDTDKIPGVINYQWQQSSDGTTWTNITGATSQTLTLAQAQVNQQVRVTATYTDANGSSENPISTATSIVANVNDVGIVSISGVTAQGNTVTANVTDIDGLIGVTIAYQWQQSSDNGTTWNNITGATNQTLTLDSSLVGQLVRVNTTYTDALGGSENIFSVAISPISALLESIFTSTTTPTSPNFTDGPGVDYELGMKFTSAKAGQIQAIRYYKSPSETGTHVGRIWSSIGTLLASVTFTNETASGWQQQALSRPLTISANTTYVVSVNTNSYYADTPNGFATAITSGDLTAPIGAGVYNETISAFPTQVYQNENYYRDIVFAPTTPNPNNKPGTVSISGTTTQNQILTANVSDTDGISGVINYQWQQLDGSNWTNITGATAQTFTLTQAQVNQQVRVTATYTDTFGSSENPISTATLAVVNVNDLGTVILKGSATIGYTLDETVFDNDGLTGVAINYQWQQLANSIWTNIAGAIAKSLTLTTALLGQQVRVLASYIDALGSSENVASAGVTVAAQNAIVVENQKTGTTAWEISNLATNNEIAGYGDATSINKGQALNLKISLAQVGQYRIDVYRLGYYGGTGGRLITSVTGLNGVVQASPTMTNASTKLVEWNWNTSYTLQTGSDWTSGLYFAKLTDSRTGKQNYIQFVLRDDNRPADIGFQDAITTAAAYNNYGGYSVYDFNSAGGQRAYQVSFDRPFQYSTATASEQFNNTLTWEYNMTRWLESQGYDVSYYTNLDVSTNPLQLYSQKTFLSVGHDEYWSGEQRNNVEKARDNGTNLAFFSANTAYWQVRFEPSTSGQANRVMTVYKDTSGIGTGAALDPIAQTNPTAATTLFRSPEVNRPENALLGVGYIGDWGSSNVYNGFDYVVSNASDPYYANTGLRNGDKLTGLVGYEWDGLLNNGLAPTGLIVLSQSPVQPQGLLPPLPLGTSTTISNAVRYTAASGAKVFSTGSIQWVWGLDSDGVTNPRVDIRAQQIAVNVFLDMGVKPQTSSIGIVIT